MTVTCPCGTAFEAERRTAKYCSPTCRSRARRGTVKRPKDAAGESDFERLTRAELDELGKVDTLLGQQVLIVARRMARGGETGAAVVSLSKEHSRLMAELRRDGGEGDDPVTAARKRARAKRGLSVAG